MEFNGDQQHGRQIPETWESPFFIFARACQQDHKEQKDTGLLEQACICVILCFSSCLAGFDCFIGEKFTKGHET